MTDERFYAAILSLRGNPDFATFMEKVGELREKCKEDLTVRPVSDIQLTQGEAKAYGKLLTAVAEASDVMTRLKSK